MRETETETETNTHTHTRNKHELWHLCIVFSPTQNTHTNSQRTLERDEGKKLSLEDATSEGNLDLERQLAAQVSELERQGKRDAVKQLFSSDSTSGSILLEEAETSDNFECPYKLGCGSEMTLQGVSCLQGVLLPILQGRLYLTCTSGAAVIQPQKRELWLAFNESMCHSPLRAGIYNIIILQKNKIYCKIKIYICIGFGPLNLGTTHRMCKKLHALLSSPEHRRTKIIFHTSTQAADITSAGSHCTCFTGTKVRILTQVEQLRC